MLLKALQYLGMLTVHFLFTQNHTFPVMREPSCTAICDLCGFLAFSPFRHPSLTDGAQSHRAIHNSSLYHKFLVPPPPPNACLMVARILMQQCWHAWVGFKTFLPIGLRKSFSQWKDQEGLMKFKINKRPPMSENDTDKYLLHVVLSQERWTGKFCKCLAVWLDLFNS